MISLVIIALIIFYLISRAYNVLIRSNKSEYNKVYRISAINLTVFVLVGLSNVLIYKELIVHFEDWLALLLTSIAYNGLIFTFVFSILSAIAELIPEKIIKLFNPLILITKYLFIPITFIYLLIRKLFYHPTKQAMTEDDFLDILDKAEQEDGINENESQLIKSVLDFDDLKVLDIYTPRTELIAVKINSSNEEIIKKFKDSGFSRLPVYEKSIDNIVGTINHKDFYNQILLDKKDLLSIIQRPVEVTEYMELSDLLALLKINKAHMAIVKDEFGGTIGIVTMEDVLEEIVGDIFDEHDKVIETIRRIDENTYIILGTTYLEELENIIEINDFEEEDFLTVNGWVLASLGKMGVKGDKFKYKDNLVTVLKADSKRILEIELKHGLVDENKEGAN